ncbi:bifunctional GNAT family N-acetyltransferase/acetate--CoA ligase family protein [soil metagenome]
MPTEGAPTADRWSVDVVLGDGESALIRPIAPDDADALATFHHRQSPASIYRRYFSPKSDLTDAELHHFTTVDFRDRVGLVVESHDELVAWAGYERWPGRDDADTAFMVDDAHQGNGIATLLLEHLATIAVANGIGRFTAEVLADNHPMLSVFAGAGWPVERHVEAGVIEVDLDIDDTTEYLDSVARREQRADSRAMARLLLPRSIAVVGATDEPGSVGAALWQHVNQHSAGPVFAVNPRQPILAGEPAWARVADIPADVWLAVVAVPAHALPAVIDDCIAARVRGAVVVTSVDGTGVAVEPLVARARSHGMRIIGPSSMGVASSRTDVGLQASLLPTSLLPGSVAVSMQSGTLGGALLWAAEQREMGLSWFVSLGDRADVASSDLLQFWDDDDTTRVIGLYTESLGEPRRFARIARRVSRRRPIVAVRTGAAAAGPGGSALYQHCGLIEVSTVSALLDTARVLASQPVLQGPRVAVIANSRSPRTLADAAVTAAGLTSADPPIVLDWSASPDDYARAIAEALARPDVDGVLAVHTPVIADQLGAPARAIERAAAGSAKPVVAVLAGRTDGPVETGARVPGFTFPEPAAAALGCSYAYGRWLATEADASIDAPAGTDTDGAAAVIADALGAGESMLGVDAQARVLSAYGITATPTRFVAAGQAVAAAHDVGYPVAVKAEHRRPGRSARAGVALDLGDDADVQAAIGAMAETLGPSAGRVIVQPMQAPGIDVRVAAGPDDEVGPLVSVGLGGTQADVLADETPRLAPLSSRTAAEMVQGSRAGEALRRAATDADAVVELVRRAGQLVADHGEIAALDLNALVAPDGAATVTDIVIRIAPAAARDLAGRHL